MKHFIALFLGLTISCVLFAQAQDGTVAYERKQHPAAVQELPYEPDVVTAALNDFLSKKGKSKGTDLKGFSTFRNTGVTQSDSINADLYFKIERKSRQEKNTTMVSLLLKTPKEEKRNKEESLLNMEQAKMYLNELVPTIVAFDLEMQIKDQNESLTKAEAKLKGIAENSNDLEKKKESIEKDIVQNKQEQQNQLNEINTQKQKLAQLVSQRKQ